ncbi:MAG: lysine--tRNA ligase [Candidatus Bipolaricaulia bacterium]
MSDTLREERRQKLAALRERGIDPFEQTRYERNTDIAAIHARFSHLESGEESNHHVRIAGRVVGRRVMGGLSFLDVRDEQSQIQLFAAKDDLDEALYEHFTEIEIGDIVGASGIVFRTKRGELSVKIDDLTLLAKALRPLPEKWQGLKNVEARYRRRYLDLIANPDVREVFRTRSRMIRAMRDCLDDEGFLEVETPVLQPLYGGAFARPFTTYHNELDQTLYLRISDELYLKRLIVGGLEKVYEIGHNFRNEGVSAKHNPEFTMMECYQAYADYEDMMALTEQLVFHMAQSLGKPTLEYQGQEIDLTPPWPRLTLHEAIRQKTEIDIETHADHDSLTGAIRDAGLSVESKPTWGGLVDELLSEYVEPDLVQPTFLKDYPLEISPLAKQKSDASHLVERFEVFVIGREIGNAFTELNDPIDQRERFLDQRAQREHGDEEAQELDEDFIEAMEHGMPPTGGLGIGVDRLAMLFTDSPSIRDVILFPALRRQADGSSHADEERSANGE